MKLNTADPIARHGFTQLPNFILRNSEISANAKTAYALLLSFAWHNNLCFPGQERLAEQIETLENDLGKVMRYSLLRRRQQLTELIAHRGFQTLRIRLAQAEQRSDELADRLEQAAREALRRARRRWEQPHAFLAHFDLRARQEREWLRLNRLSAALLHPMRLLLAQKRGRMESLRGELEQLNPTAILQRGYAIVFDAAGKVLKDAAHVAPGEEITLRLARGRLAAVARKILAE